MKSQIKLWKKQEKRIVKLLYKKGFLKDFEIKNFYWESFKCLNKKRYKSKSGYRYRQYVPELHFGTVDYWGEGDDKSIVDYVLDVLYWNNLENNEICIDDEGYYLHPESTFKIQTREQFIKYLSKLPNKVNDNKIRKALIIK